jgi:hypothetical protein
MGNIGLGNKEDDNVSHQIIDSDLGHHYSLSYSDIPSLRKFYSEYVRYEIEYNQGNIIFLSYYESPINVKFNLTNSIEKMDVGKYEEDGSLHILDSLEVLFGEYPWNFKPNHIKTILNKIQNSSRARDLSLIIDTAPFYHCCKPKDLIDFEKTFETNFLRSNWRGICLYNKRNMARVLPNDQKELLKMYHKGQFTVDEIAA